MSVSSAGPASCDGEQRQMHSQPAFWKRWTVSMVAVYPPLVCLVFASRYVLEGMPTVVTLFMIALCLTGLSTGLILPFLNQRLAGWLSR